MYCYELDDWDSNSNWDTENFLLNTTFRMALGSNQPTEALSPGIKWPECDNDHSPPSNAKVKNVKSLTSVYPLCHHGDA
jgi:hypothetical protein